MKPTNLDPLYPDPIGPWEELEDIKLERVIKRAVLAAVAVTVAWGGFILYAVYRGAFA